MGMKEDALEYHRKGRKGKIETGLTKEMVSQNDITLAYSPGVAEPCKEIARDPNLVFEYTAKGNLVAVVSNGTAVLGLGNIGPLAAKPVMEGKAALFKTFADIDCYDIELNAPDVDDVVRACCMLEPTFGGINLEDIKAPECFEIEEILRDKLNIPVFHDDQHGTAIVSAAALLNGCEITKRNIKDTVVVVNGAGAAAIACAQMYINIGILPENLIMCDTKGVIYKGRTEGMNKYKSRFAVETSKRTLKEALDGADVLCGCSVAGAVTQDMILKMKKDPLLFVMANPDPEIHPDDIKAVRPDAIIATGRSDFPNQVNNVLGYPYIFRGALDVLAQHINDAMKMAAVHALAMLAKKDVPDAVSRSYAGVGYTFGREYLIPKPFDQRLLLWVAPAVAKAAMETGVARKKIDLEKYVDLLEERLGAVQSVTRKIKRAVVDINRSKKYLPKVVFPEGSSLKILKAADQLIELGICEPILLGDETQVANIISEHQFKFIKNSQIVYPKTSPHLKDYTLKLYEMRCRKGMTRMGATELMKNDFHHYAAMMVQNGNADAYCSGAHHNYSEALRPALQIIGTESDKILAGIYMLVWRNRRIFVADATVNIEITAEQMAQIAIQTYDTAKIYETEQVRVGMLSFSNFGSSTHVEAIKVRTATEIVKRKRPDIEIDGELQADTAVSAELLATSFQFSTLKAPANVLIFPNLTAGNIAYKLLNKLGGATIIGPILVGMKKPVNVLQRNSDVEEIVNMVSLLVHRLQNGLA